MSTNSLSFTALEMLATINDANQFGWPKPVKSTICQTRGFVDGDVFATQAISVNYAAIPYKRTLNLMLPTSRTSKSRTLSPYSKWKSLLEWIFYKTHPKRDFGPGNKENYKTLPPMVNKSLCWNDIPTQEYILWPSLRPRTSPRAQRTYP